MRRFALSPRPFLTLLAGAALACNAAAQTVSLQQAQALLDAGEFHQADQTIAQLLAAQPQSAAAHDLDARLLATRAVNVAAGFQYACSASGSILPRNTMYW